MKIDNIFKIENLIYFQNCIKHVDKLKKYVYYFRFRFIIIIHIDTLMYIYTNRSTI